MSRPYYWVMRRRPDGSVGVERRRGRWGFAAEIPLLVECEAITKKEKQEGGSGRCDGRCWMAVFNSSGTITALHDRYDRHGVMLALAALGGWGAVRKRLLRQRQLHGGGCTG